MEGMHPDDTVFLAGFCVYGVPTFCLYLNHVYVSLRLGFPRHPHLSMVRSAIWSVSLSADAIAGTVA